MEDRYTVDSQMTAQELETLGILIAGGRRHGWGRNLAKLLGKHETTVWRWKTGAVIEQAEARAIREMAQTIKNSQTDNLLSASNTESMDKYLPHHREDALRRAAGTPVNTASTLKTGLVDIDSVSSAGFVSQEIMNRVLLCVHRAWQCRYTNSRDVLDILMGYDANGYMDVFITFGIMNTQDRKTVRLTQYDHYSNLDEVEGLLK